MTEIEPTSVIAAEIKHLFTIMGESQTQWQDLIGFGEEGHMLREINNDLHLFFAEDSDERKKGDAALRNYYMVKLGLIMTEASEAFDEMRKHTIGERYYSTDDKGFQKPEGVLSELADVVIRIWSLIGETGLSSELADAIVEKINYNHTRSLKHGGKEI